MPIALLPADALGLHRRRHVAARAPGEGHVISLPARRRTMRAADLVDTHSIREAAVLGGIVRCIIASGHCDVEYVARYAHDIMGAFNLVGVDRSTPCPTEVGMVLERFEEVYGRKLTD